MSFKIYSRPAPRKKRGAECDIYYAVLRMFERSFLMGLCDGKLCYAAFSDKWQDLQNAYPLARLIPGDQAVQKQCEMICTAYRNNAPLRCDVYFEGTPFQIAVWEVVADIPRGADISYASIAQKINHPRAVRAVGTAVGANPVVVFLPCHRVRPAAGGYGGYAFGTALKEHILKTEASIKKAP